MRKYVYSIEIGFSLTNGDQNVGCLAVPKTRDGDRNFLTLL